MAETEWLPLWGAAGFGALVGWFIYYLNRYRRAEIHYTDLATVICAIGGAAVLALFPAGTALFGAYGVGLFAGFFGYLLMLVWLVTRSSEFDGDFFLDGRRKRPREPHYIPGENDPGGGQHPALVATFPHNFAAAAHPRRLVAPAAAESDPVTAICCEEWPGAQADCNAFVRAVTQRLGMGLAGNADAIMAAIRGPEWTSHGVDGLAASAAAGSGRLVVAGLSATELGERHGHVVIVVAPAGTLGHGKYPYAYWGSLNATIRPDGGRGTTLNYSFDLAARDRVFYASVAL